MNVDPEHTPEGPEIASGCDGAVVAEATLRVLAGPVPQTLAAATEMVPPTVPEIEFMKRVDDEPVQPLGKVQV